MRKRNARTLGLGLLMLLFLLGCTSSALAQAPPPVQQNLGLGDTAFNLMVEADCRECHNQAPPDPYPVDPTYLPDRHHLLVGQPIPPSSDVPKPDADGDGIPDASYDCLNCHDMVWDPVLGTYVMVQNFRDCTGCHVQTAGEATVHHQTAEAQGGDCTYCHGGFVDPGLLDADGDTVMNSIDPEGICSVTTTQPCTSSLDCPVGETCLGVGWIPTYQPSLVTPYPSNKPNGGEPANSLGTLTGNCNYCHDSGTTPDGTVVQNNPTNHHGTGLLDTVECLWCHFTVSGPAIRTCEICHGIPSLHNIQFAGQEPGFPSDGTVVPGQEPPWLGHIGNQDDCWGCHGFAQSQAMSPGSGPVVPGLYTVSASSLEAGAVLIMGGTAFVNLVQNPMTGAYDITLESDVMLTDGAGMQTVVEPISVTGDTIEVVIPADMAAGSYQIAAKKVSRTSNPLNLAITPAAVIDSATCAEGQRGIGVVSIAGSGFGGYLEAADSGTSVSGTVTLTTGKGKNRQTTTSTEVGEVVAWADSEIVANFSVCASEVTVHTVFDSTAMAPVGSDGGGDPPADPEICDDGVDNDGDGKVDCADKGDCKKDPACK